MSTTTREHVGSFTAHSSDGNAVKIEMYQDYNIRTNIDGTIRKSPTIPSFYTLDDRRVDHTGKGKYRIVDDETDLVTDDPAAP